MSFFHCLFFLVVQLLMIFTRKCSLFSTYAEFGRPLYLTQNNKLLSVQGEDKKEDVLICNIPVDSTYPNKAFETCSLSGKRQNSTFAKSIDDVIPKKDHCAQYYDFRFESKDVFWEPHLRECSHPQLFDAETLSCRHYSLVNCGLRFEPKDACDYMRHQCLGSHCIPCHFRYPSCRGLPDGLNAWPGKLFTPYFIVCIDERVVHRGTCDFQYRLHTFDPLAKACVPKEVIRGLSTTF